MKRTIKRQLIGLAVAVLLPLLSLVGCGSSAVEGGTETGTTTPSSPTLSAALKLATKTSSQTFVQGLEAKEITKEAVGQVTASGLTSLKYYITSITICEDMKITGSGWNNPTGCLEIYKGNQSDSRYTYELTQDFAPFADVARKSDDGFVDLMNDTARATLNASKELTSKEVHSYNYGYINWYLPIKLTAEVDMGSGVTFRTNDGTTATTDSNQGPITTANKNFTSLTTAEEAVVVHGNGGSWFRFQNPFVISQSDLDSNTQFALDLAFNPDGLVKGYSAGLGGCGSCILKDKVGNQILVPMLDLTPIPHKTSESVIKETYLATMKSGADNFDIRVELYSIQGDVAKTVYGVNAATLINKDTTTAVSPFPKVSFIVTGSDGKLEFQNHNGSSGVTLSGFSRQTETGASFTATVHCSDSSSGGFSVDQCTSGTKDVTFSLQSIATLQ